MALKAGGGAGEGKGTDDRSAGGRRIRAQTGDECINVSQAPTPMMEAN